MCSFKHVKILYILAGGADPSPPLGTVLGNLGVNTVNFCNNYNIYTKDLKDYFLLKVEIFIYENRSVTFNVLKPSISYFLHLLKYEKIISVKVFDRFHEKKIFCVNLYSIIKLALFKFPYLNLKQSLPILLGCVKSMNLVVVRS